MATKKEKEKAKRDKQSAKHFISNRFDFLTDYQYQILCEADLSQVISVSEKKLLLQGYCKNQHKIKWGNKELTRHGYAIRDTYGDSDTQKLYSILDKITTRISKPKSILMKSSLFIYKFSPLSLHSFRLETSHKDIDKREENSVRSTVSRSANDQHILLPKGFLDTIQKEYGNIQYYRIGVQGIDTSILLLFPYFENDESFVVREDLSTLFFKTNEYSDDFLTEQDILIFRETATIRQDGDSQYLKLPRILLEPTPSDFTSYSIKLSLNHDAKGNILIMKVTATSESEIVVSESNTAPVRYAFEYPSELSQKDFLESSYCSDTLRDL